MFKLNDKVVHLSHGVGEIVGIEEREFKPGNTQKFYIMNFMDNGAPKKVFVPFETASQRVRKVINKTQAEEVYNLLKNDTQQSIDHQTWNRRYREFMEKIHTGNIKDIAEVAKSIYKLLVEKDLSFGERKLLDQALSLLKTELSLSTGMPETWVENKIEICLTGKVS